MKKLILATLLFTSCSAQSFHKWEAGTIEENLDFRKIEIEKGTDLKEHKVWAFFFFALGIGIISLAVKTADDKE